MINKKHPVAGKSGIYCRLMNDINNSLLQKLSAHILKDPLQLIDLSHSGAWPLTFFKTPVYEKK